jgi:hypothetical protein
VSGGYHSTSTGALSTKHSTTNRFSTTILNNREVTKKIAKWVIELSLYDIVYKPRTAIKAQALSDFVAEWTETQIPPNERELEYWTINFDRSLQLHGEGAGIMVTSPKGESFKYILQMHSPASNNATEYEASSTSRA